MRVCFDTNVVIDIAGKTDWFLDSYASYDIALMRKFDTYITAASTTDIVYVLHRRGMSTKESNAQLPSLFFMFDVLDVTGSSDILTVSKLVITGIVNVYLVRHIYGFAVLGQNKSSVFGSQQ